MKDLTIEIVKKNYKRYLLSSTVTFLTAMFLVVLNDIDSITIDSFKTGGIIGIFFAGIRAGVKALLESFVKETADIK